MAKNTVSEAKRQMTNWKMYLPIRSQWTNFFKI